MSFVEPAPANLAGRRRCCFRTPTDDDSTTDDRPKTTTACSRSRPSRSCAESAGYALNLLSRAHLLGVHRHREVAHRVLVRFHRLERELLEAAVLVVEPATCPCRGSRIRGPEALLVLLLRLPSTRTALALSYQALYPGSRCQLEIADLDRGRDELRLDELAVGVLGPLQVHFSESTFEMCCWAGRPRRTGSWCGVQLLVLADTG